MVNAEQIDGTADGEPDPRIRCIFLPAAASAGNAHSALELEGGGA